MNQPTKSYRIWHAPRVGSTLLCQLLSDTGLAGISGEHVMVNDWSTLQKKYSVDTYDELRDQIWQAGNGNSGIFGSKISAHHEYHTHIVDEIAGLRDIQIRHSYEEVWSDIFPNCKNLVITRLNKIEQSVSWWKAIQDNIWHITEDAPRHLPDSFYQDKYDFNALMHLHHETVLRDAATQDYLSRNNLDFITIVYEDLISDPGSVILKILDYLELDHENISTPRFSYSKTADNINEEWVERFKQELQANWERKVWV